MQTLLLSLRMLARDARAGELRVLVVALVIAVASVTSVGFFADRVGRALTQESHQLIGADLVVSADRPMPEEYTSQAATQGLRTATAATFPSMASFNGKAHLSGFKAVSNDYPLRGSLRVAPDRNQADAPTKEVPAPGTVWLDEQLASSLAAKPGDMINVGDITLRFTHILTLEPDRGASFLAVAPRLLMNLADLPRTNLIQVGSRVNYRLLVAGADKVMKPYTDWVRARLGRGQRLEEVSNSRPEIRNTVARAQQFLGLVALLAVVLAAVSVALGSRRFMQRHLDGCAVLRAMGASQGMLFGLYAMEFLWLGLIGSAVGTLLGWGVHALLTALLGYLLAVELPSPTLMPAVQGFATGILLLLGFALPPLIQLAGVPPVRVIRRELGNPRSATLIAYGLGGVALFLLILWQARDLKLGLIAAGGFAIAMAVSAALTYGVLKLLARLRGEAGFSWRYGVAAMRRRSLATVTQVVALSLGLAALLMLTITRGDLIDKWQTTIPAGAPNRFVINILPEQRATVADVFRQNGVAPPTLEPMIRGRLISVNGKPIGPENFSDDRARRLVDREFNLSYTTQLPSHNQVIEGQWFSPSDLEQGALSMEEGIAKTLGLKIGDHLVYEVAGQRFEAPVTNLRKVAWDTMKVNFFVITNPKLLADFPTTYITSFYLPAGKEGLTDEMVARMPNLTLIDVSAMINQIKSVIDQVVEAVQFIFLFTLAAGMTVLYAALTASADERTREAGILRSLGASSAQLRRAQWAEFILTGALAGLFASTIAFSVGYAVTVFVLNLEPGFNPWLWVAGIFSGAACTIAGGWLALSGALKRPPVATLREAV